jgi:hypothetical protein
MERVNRSLFKVTIKRANPADITLPSVDIYVVADSRAEAIEKVQGDYVLNAMERAAVYKCFSGEVSQEKLVKAFKGKLEMVCRVAYSYIYID